MITPFVILSMFVASIFQPHTQTPINTLNQKPICSLVAPANADIEILSSKKGHLVISGAKTKTGDQSCIYNVSDIQVINQDEQSVFSSDQEAFKLNFDKDGNQIGTAQQLIDFTLESDALRLYRTS